MIKNIVVLITAAAAISFSLTPAAFAANETMRPVTMMERGEAAATNAAEEKEVGYCSICKVYYSHSDTKKMRMMDAEGHKLVLTPMSKVPRGAQLGHMGMKEPTKKKH